MECGPKGSEPAATALPATAEELLPLVYGELRKLAAGKHLLAISVHNVSPSSTDLRLSGVTLVGVESAGQ